MLVSYLVGKEVSPYIGLDYHTDIYYKHVLKGIALVLPNIFIQSRKNILAQNIVVDNSAKLVAGIFQYIKDTYKLEFRIQEAILDDWKLNKYLNSYGLKNIVAS